MNAPRYDRALLLHGPKRNEILSLDEIEQYGLDSFSDSDYISIYGMRPRDWYRKGVRLIGRTAVECTRDALGDHIGRDISSIATRIQSKNFVVIDPFAGSCNTLHWILRYLPNSRGVAFELDPQVVELTKRNIARLDHWMELINGDYDALLDDLRFPADQTIVAFVAPPWGAALDEAQGLDLRRTMPPITQVIDRIATRYADHKILFATQVYEKVNPLSLADINDLLDWTETHVYHINTAGRNHGILLGTKRCVPQ
jgi:hypothetical protein